MNVMIYKYKLTVAITLLAIHSATAQPTVGESDEDGRLFLKAFASYGFVTRGSFQVTPSYSTKIDASGTVESFETQKNGMGAGLRFGGGVGLILGRYINIGLDGEYLMGKTLTSSSSLREYKTTVVNPEAPSIRMPDTTISSGSYELNHKILSLIPSITFKAISTNDFNVYTRVGVVLGIPLKIEATEYSSSRQETKLPPPPAVASNGFIYLTETTSESTYEYKASFGIGYQAALGIQRYLGEGNNVSFFFEVVSNSMNLRPSEYNQTFQNTIRKEKRYNDTELISFDQSRSIQVFKKSGTSNPVTTGAPPLQVTTYQSPQISMAVNSLNIGAGFTFRF